MIFDGAGKCAPFVTEELARQERFGEPGAVHRDEWHVPAMAGRVDGAGDQLFPRTGLAFDQHCRIDARDGANLLIDLLHDRALTEKIVKLRPLIEQAAQIVDFGHIVKKTDYTP